MICLIFDRSEEHHLVSTLLQTTRNVLSTETGLKAGPWAIEIRSCCYLLLLLGLAYSIHIGARPLILTLISVDKIQISLLTVTQVSLQPHLLHAIWFIRDTVKYSISMSHNFFSNFDINVPECVPMYIVYISRYWSNFC